MQVIMMKSKKGGTGKSLFSREFSLGMAGLGINVAILDTSEQANDDILENQQRSLPYTIKECLLDGIPLRTAARQVRKHLWLIPGHPKHNVLNDFIRQEHYPLVIHDMVAELRASLKPAKPYVERFPWWNQERVPLSLFQLEPTTAEEFASPPESLDYLLIDSDALITDELTFALLECTDGILVPYEPTELDWQSYHQLKDDLHQLYQRRPKDPPPILGILPNKVLHVKDSKSPKIYLKALYNSATEHVFQPVHFSKIYNECLNTRLGSLEHPTGATDRTVKEICSILLEIIGYPGELAGLKYCEKCVEAYTEAQEEKAEA